MATRFTYQALAAAALSIALGVLFGGTTTTSAALNSTAEAMQLDAPAAPSRCRIGRSRERDPFGGHYTSYFVSWRDNSDNEDGFTMETWLRNESGVWVLYYSRNLPANSTLALLGPRPDARFRVKAFNAAGDSAWSNWAH